MDTSFRLFPEQASTLAPRIDALYLFLCGLSAVMTLLIAGLIIFFAIRYRSNSAVDRSKAHISMALEVIWIVVPALVMALIFVWSAWLFFDASRAPADGLDIDVIGKQWMWKLQHPLGRREINELHVPIGQPVRLNMISQDVIHSFYVPAFRIKQDVLPGRYTRTWFQATTPGEYHLFCAEYCGTNHSQMIGRVVVMTPADYQAWLSGETSTLPPAVAGERLFEDFRCGSCHAGGGKQSRGPALAGLFGQTVTLTDGSSVVVDENYIRESILRPQAKVVAGFQPIMPTFEGQIGEEGLMHLVAYIKSLGPQGGSQR